MNAALIVVDMTNDFMDDGVLPVAGGRELARAITDYAGMTSSIYKVIVYTQCWHVDPGDHISPPGVPPNMKTTWPAHGIPGTPGVELVDELDPQYMTHLCRKGMYGAGYSAWEGVVYSKADPWGEPRHLEEVVYGADLVDICGVAAEECVKATALDGLKCGHRTRVLRSLVGALGDPDETWTELEAAGVELTPEGW